MSSRQGNEKNGLNKTGSNSGTKDNDNTAGEASKNARTGGPGSSSSTNSYDWQQVFGSFRKKLQRHPSSYEREPDEDVTPEQATAKVDNGSKKRSLTVEMREKPLLKLPPPTDRIDEIKDTFISVEVESAPNDDQLVTKYSLVEFPPEEESGAKKRTQRQPPSLSRTSRVESDTEPIEKEKILKLLKNTVMSVCFSEDQKKEESKTPDEKPEAECLSPGKIDINFDYRRLSRNISEKTITSLIQERTPDKEHASSSRTWIPKSVSKILSDNKSSVANVAEKKRAKSPSSILEYAQRKLPKWAAFSRKSDEEACVDIPKSKVEEGTSTTTPKLGHTFSHSIEEIEQPVTVTLKQPSFSDNEDTEKSNKTLCRWFVSDEEHPTIDPTAEGTSKLTKTLSCEPLGSAYTNVKPSFSFFKNKECKYNKLKQKAEQKQKSRKGDKLMTLDITEKNCDLRKAKSDAGDYRKISEIKGKSSTAKEKGKFFSKQKSKDKSAINKESSPTVRKNSMKFGTLKNLWFKGNRDKSLLVDNKIKATSAEALELDRIQQHSDQEFLLSSLQVFLALSPTSAKLQVNYRQ